MTVVINNTAMNTLEHNVARALEMTAEAIVTEIKASEVLPYKEGFLTEHTFADTSQSTSGKVSVVSDMPYARRLYYHPEYNFHRSPWTDGKKVYKGNRFAGGLWFEPYKQGRRGWVVETFAKYLERYC